MYFRRTTTTPPLASTTTTTHSTNARLQHSHDGHPHCRKLVTPDRAWRQALFCTKVGMAAFVVLWIYVVLFFDIRDMDSKTTTTTRIRATNTFTTTTANDDEELQSSRVWGTGPAYNAEFCDAYLGDQGSQSDKATFHVCEPLSSASLQPTKNDPGSLQCKWNSKLSTSFCEAKNLMVDPLKINVAKGGEALQLVSGRPEVEEFPRYQHGAYQLAHCQLDSEAIQKQRSKLPHQLGTIMKEIVVQKEDTASHPEDGKRENHHDAIHHDMICPSYEERPTLFVTRYEYANLYHTYTDWYFAYQAAFIALGGDAKDVTERELRIIFLDGHAAGSLDAGWQLLFPNAEISYVSSLQKNNQKDKTTNEGNDNSGIPHLACFRHAIFVPAGYQAPISIESLGPVVGKVKECVGSYWQSKFRQAMVEHAQAYASEAKLHEHLSRRDELSSDSTENEATMSLVKEEVNNNSTQKEEIKVLLMSRQDYYSHPRMEGKVTRRIGNEEELMSMMRQQSSAKYTITVQRVVLEEHDMADQILMVQDAGIVVGMHGAGLTHIFLARPETLLLEIKPPGFVLQQHFRMLAQLARCNHWSYIMGGSKPKDLHTPYNIPVDRLEKVFQDGLLLYFAQRNQPNTTKNENAVRPLIITSG